MTSALHILRMIPGILLPAFCGMMVTRMWAPKLARGARGWVAGFLLGQSGLTIAMFAGSLAGLPLTMAGALGLLAGLTAGMLVIGFILMRLGLRGRKEGREDFDEPVSENVARKSSMPQQILCGVMLGALACVFLLTFADALMGEVNSRAGQGIWGFKAKVFFAEGGLPVSFFQDKERAFAQFSYPLGFPLFLTWLYLWMGTVDDYAIRIIPPALFVALSLVLYGFFRENKVSRVKSLCVVTLCCSSVILIQTSQALFAEGLLLLQAVSGAAYLVEFLGNPKRKDRLVLGALLLGGAAWVKNEGLVIALIGVAVILLCRFERHGDWRGILKEALLLLAPFAVFVVPWLAFKRVLNIQTRDFDFSLAAMSRFAETMPVVLRDFLERMVLKPGKFSGVWIVWLWFVAAYWKTIVGDRRLCFLALTTVVMVGVYAGIFLFSTRDIEWHVVAVGRILLFPACLAWMLIGLIRTNGAKE